MKIARIEKFILRATLARPFAYSQGWYKERTALIVRILTDDGLEGIGECFGPPEAAAAVIDNVFEPLLIGSDPLCNEVIWDSLYNKLRDHGQKGIPIEALSGIDIALWDIKGKAAGVPIYKLLGGGFRTRVQAYATGFYRQDGLIEQEAVLCEEAASYVSAGFNAMKIKFGFGLEDDRRVARALRRALGDTVHLMADANHAYDASTAIRLGRVLEEADYDWFEEPVIPEDLEGYRLVHDALDVPIAGGEAEFTRFGMKDLIVGRLVDIVQPDCCGTGGLTEAKRISMLANTFSVRCVPHVWGTRVATAAALHLIASLSPTPAGLAPLEPLLEYDCSEHPLRTDVINERIAPDGGGMVEVPQNPGLGVTLNLEFVKGLARRAV
jgi:D-galactarolactone cycloisomerase